MRLKSFLCLFCVFTTCFSVYAETEPVTPVPPTLSAAQVSIPLGCTGIVGASLTLGTPQNVFTSLVFDVNFDNTVLDLAGTSVNDALSQLGVQTHSEIVTSNTATITVSYTTGALPPGEIVRMHLEPLSGNAGDLVSIQISNAYGYSGRLKIPLVPTAGSVLVGTADPNCDPEATPGRPLDTDTMPDPPMPEGLASEGAETEKPCEGCNCDKEESEDEAAGLVSSQGGGAGGGGMLPAMVLLSSACVLMRVLLRKQPVDDRKVV